MRALRKNVFRQLDPEIWPSEGLSPVNKLIVTLVLTSIVLIVLETEKTVTNTFAHAFELANIVLVGVFALEFVLRVWTIGEREEYTGLLGRLRFLVTFSAIVDLLAIVPFALGFVGSDTFLFRLFRLLRILSIAKLGRYTAAIQHARMAIASRGHDLALSIGIAMLVLLLSSSAMYVIEGGEQPETFGSIPRSMWWAIATLTTVGYGDVYPLTALGRFLAGVTALSSLGLVALPAGILAAAFSEIFQGSSNDEKN